MYKYTKQFVEFCRNNLDLNNASEYVYTSLGICIIDCVYSLRTDYRKVTKKLVKKYADTYMDGDIKASGDTVSKLIQHIENAGGPEGFSNVLNNHQKLGGKGAIPKCHVCYQLAKYLKALGVETIEDFRTYKHQDLLEAVIRAVRGMGDSGTNYLFMLAGDPDRCKPDIWLHRCIKEVCGEDISNDDCQVLFTEVVAELKPTYNQITVRALDKVIWDKYSSKK